MTNSLRLILLFTAALSAAHSAEFSFNAILRSGSTGSGASGWELGVGPITGPTGGVQYDYNGLTPTWADNSNSAFRIGYIESSNTAYIAVFGQGGLPAFTSTFNPVGAFPTSPNQTWTVYASVEAQARPVRTAIRVNNLQLDPSTVTVLEPLSQTTLVATQLFSSGSDSLTSPVQFRTDTSGGDWYIDGTIRMNGLAAYTTNGATGDNLRFSLSAIASDNPEPMTSLLCFCGLLGLAAFRKYHLKKTLVLAQQNNNLCEPLSSSLP